jgi:hypothetical protein
MANTELLQQYRDSRPAAHKKFYNLVTNPVLMNLFLLGKLPIGFFIGAKVKHIDGSQCLITVPYRYGNNNPFRSTYFGVLACAAEMCTGLPALLATYEAKPSIAMLAVHMEADFTKKATGVTTFTCTQVKEITETVEQAILTGEPKAFEALTIGTSRDGEEESRFKITWSFKARI